MTPLDPTNLASLLSTADDMVARPENYSRSQLVEMLSITAEALQRISEEYQIDAQDDDDEETAGMSSENYG